MLFNSFVHVKFQISVFSRLQNLCFKIWKCERGFIFMVFFRLFQMLQGRELSHSQKNQTKKWSLSTFLHRRRGRCEFISSQTIETLWLNSYHFFLLICQVLSAEIVVAVIAAVVVRGHNLLKTSLIKGEFQILNLPFSLTSTMINTFKAHYFFSCFFNRSFYQVAMATTSWPARSTVAPIFSYSTCRRQRCNCFGEDVRSKRRANESCWKIDGT